MLVREKEQMENHSISTFIVDSFTDRPFKGNPAGVCIISSHLSDEVMLQIAQELNLSETAFLSPQESSNTFAIRFFSPKMEIALCGHATLASARVVFSIHKLNEVHFMNIQNLDLFAKQSNDQIVMEFPIYETRPADAPPALLAALGIEAIKNSVYN
jgi:PhzF family phenazine biosynthesis protein